MKTFTTPSGRIVTATLQTKEEKTAALRDFYRFDKVAESFVIVEEDE